MDAEKSAADIAADICFGSVGDWQVKIEKALARERARAEKAERECEEMFADLTAGSGPRARAQMRIDEAAWPTQTQEQRFNGKTIAKERAASVVATFELAMKWKADAAELAALKAAAGQRKPTPEEIVAKIDLAGLDGHHLDRFEHALERDRLIHEVEVAALRGALPATVCSTCSDTHTMPATGFMCTHCPLPCMKCRGQACNAYCASTPCTCACHLGAR